MEKKCSFCGKREYQIDYLEEKNNIIICNECLELCFALITEKEKKNNIKDSIFRSKEKCSFCDKQENKVNVLIAGPQKAMICDECAIKYYKK